MPTMTLMVEDKGQRIAMQQSGSPFDIIADLSEGDVPRKKMLKDVMRVGNFVKESENLKFSVDLPLLHHWATSFQSRKAAGLKTPITRMHDYSGDPESGYGWVDDMYVSGDRLWAVMDLRGADAIKAAERSDVSVYSPSAHTDGDGKIWERPIKHVCMCTDPLITGLGEFKTLALQESAPKKGSEQMDPKKVAELAKMYGVKTVVTAENADAVMDEINIAASASTKELTELKAANKKAADEATAKKKKEGTEEVTASEMQPALVEALSDSRSLKIDRLVQMGKCSLDAANKLKAQFIGDDGAAIAASQGNDKSTFDAVLEAFETNEPVKLGEETGAQALVTLAASQNAAGGKKPNALQADADARVEAAKK